MSRSPNDFDRIRGCALLQRASFCGVVEARSAMAELSNCGELSEDWIRDWQLSSVDEIGTVTFFPSKNMCLQDVCYLEEEKTIAGVVLSPVGVVIGVPIVLVLGAVACLFPVQGCPLVDYFEKGQLRASDPTERCRFWLNSSEGIH